MEGQAPQQQKDVYEVVLSSLSVPRPRNLGDCWLGCRLWEELGLDKFWCEALGERRGAVQWSMVMELLAVNRLCAPGSELSIHERWFSRTARRFLLRMRRGGGRKDRLDRALDRRSNIAMPLWVISKSAGAIFFGVECQILLYDSTSTYF